MSNPSQEPPKQPIKAKRLWWLVLLGFWLLFGGGALFASQLHNNSSPQACQLKEVEPYSFPLARPPYPKGKPLAPDWVRRPNRPYMRGVSLGLYFKNQAFDYAQFLYDIKRLGATHVGFVISWYQRDVRSTTIGRHPQKTVSDARLITTIKQARAHGLRVFLLPIIRLQQRGPDDWRGVIKPTDLDAWWRSYRAYILHYAALSKLHGVELFSVGSELVSMEGHRERWARLIRNIRRLFPGPLVYSANWDHYEPVTFWEELDYIGISNYYELSKKILPDVSLLIKAWSGIRAKIERWKRKYPRQKLMFTEVGYYSQKGTNIYPWDYTRDKERSLEEQRRCYQAFTHVWGQSKLLRGSFFWNWFSQGGPKDKGYTPRGKPAECELRHWYSTIAKREKQQPGARWLRPRPVARAGGWLLPTIPRPTPDTRQQIPKRRQAPKHKPQR